MRIKVIDLLSCLFSQSAPMQWSKMPISFVVSGSRLFSPNSKLAKHKSCFYIPQTPDPLPWTFSLIWRHVVPFPLPFPKSFRLVIHDGYNSCCANQFMVVTELSSTWIHAETCSSGQLSPSQSRKLSLRQEYVPGFMSDLVFHPCDCVLHIVDLRCPANPLSFIWLFPLHTYGTSEDSHTALQSVVNQQSRPSESLFKCDSSELPR